MTPSVRPRIAGPVVVLMGLAVVSLAVVVGSGTRPAVADGERAGPVTVITTDGSPLQHGGSDTSFTFGLPPDAACPGDSADDGYRIQSFIVPDGVDPAGLTYESTKPAGDGNWALYAVTSDPYVQGLTSVAEQRGDPGLIDGLPAFDFAVFPPGTLAEGSNRLGIACTLYNETVRYWDAEIVLTDTPEDTPAQLTWVIPGAPSGSAASFPTARFVVGGVVVVLLVIGGAIVLARRRRTSNLRVKETSR